MIMMTAVITLFANITTTVTNSRALVGISDRLRTVQNRLQFDLAGHTATTIPPLRPEDGEGYLEIIEGPNTDAWSVQNNPAASPASSWLGPSGHLSVPNPTNGALTSYFGGYPANTNSSG